MKLGLAAVGLAITGLVLAGCGAPERTPAEQAFLDDLQKASSQISNTHPDRDIEDGRIVCSVLAGIKPEERNTSMGILHLYQGYSFALVHGAVKHLCPENTPPSG